MPAAGWRTDWGDDDCEAKGVLRAMIISGKVREEDRPAYVQRLNPLFRLYKPDNFSGNYRNLQKRIMAEDSIVARDKLAIESDMARFEQKTENSIGTVRFQGSESERLMIEALKLPEYAMYINPVEKGKSKITKPASVCQTLFFSNLEVNKKIGTYSRWTKILSSKLEGSKNRLIRLEREKKNNEKKAKSRGKQQSQRESAVAAVKEWTSM